MFSTGEGAAAGAEGADAVGAGAGDPAPSAELAGASQRAGAAKLTGPASLVERQRAGADSRSRPTGGAPGGVSKGRGGKVNGPRKSCGDARGAIVGPAQAAALPGAYRRAWNRPSKLRRAWARVGHYSVRLRPQRSCGCIKGQGRQGQQAMGLENRVEWQGVGSLITPGAARHSG